MGKFKRKIINPIKKAVKKIVSFIGDMIGYNIKPLGAPDAPDQAADPGILITKNGTNESIPLVYGYRRIGSTVIYANTAGTNNAFLYVVYAICEGEIDGFRRIIIDDVALVMPQGFGYYATQQVITPVAGDAGKFFNRIQFELFTGTENQPQSILMQEAPQWKDKSRRLPGMVYAVFRFQYAEENNPYSGGVPQVQFEVYGKKVFAVSTHTSGAQLANNYNNQTKTFGTTGPYAGTNPANCLLDYLLNPRYGCGISIDEVDADSFKTAAAKFDQTVNYFDTSTGPAMTCSAVLLTDAKVMDNVKILIGACRGMLPYVQGRYRLVVEDGGNATSISSATVTIAFAVNKTHMVGGATLTGETKTTKYNQVIVNYVDPDLNFTNQQAVVSIAQDNQEELIGEFSYPTLINQSLARHMATMILKRSRNQNSLEFTATQELLDVIPGDIITVTDTVLGLSAAQFRVVNLQLNADATLSLSCTAHVASNYPFVTLDAPIVPPVLPPPTPSPQPIVPPVVPTPPPVDPLPSPIIPPPNPLPPFPNDIITLYNKFFVTGSVQDISGGFVKPVLLTHPVARVTDPLPYSVENGAMRKFGTVFIMRILAPADSTINELIIQTYYNNELYDAWEPFSDASRARYPIYAQGFGALAIDGTRSGVVTGTFPLYSSLTYKIRARKLINGQEYYYKMGGDFSWSSWPGSHTYVMQGIQITDTGFEGFFNYLAKKYGSSSKGAANLGG